MRIPDSGLRKEDILETLESYKQKDVDWKSGRVFGYIYDPGQEVTDLIHAAYTAYLSENALDPLSFPSLLRLENEVVAMVADILNAGQNVVGNFTSGGTESLILAVKTARDYSRATKPHIREPEMVLPVTGHASLFKAAHYLGIKPVVTPVEDGSFRADVSSMRAAITDNTILLVGSAPSYAHGVVDPIADIAALAQEKDLLCHVDACVGGIHLSYMKKLGYALPEFNLNVPGVTSLSVDLHKYGYAAKGASIILYKDKELRRHQMFACSRWTGYTVINPAITSSKSGGPMAAAWATLRFLGHQGYSRIVREVMAATDLLVTGVGDIAGIQVLGKPDMCMFTIGATDDRVNVYRLADRMKIKGWYLQPQFARANSPSNLHISLSQSTVPQAQAMLTDLETTVTELMAEDIDQETLHLRSEIAKLSLKFDDESFFKLAAIAGVTGEELPASMERVNQLLEVLPFDVSEFMLIEYLNNLMVPERNE